MKNILIEQEMYQKALEFLKKRYKTGWGGVGIVHTEQGHYYISVAPEVFNASLELCIETGAYLEACKFEEKITHSLCIVRDDENSPVKVLTPCGVCQERLRYYGKDVQVGVTTKDNSLKFISLEELQPYHWTNAYKEDELEHYED